MVFLVSAKLFGSEGRGIISYGTSIFASLGLLFSFNLGRTFLIETNKRESLKKDYLVSYLFLNFYAFLLTLIIGALFWAASESAQKILEPKTIIPLALTSFYYVWLVNGNSIYAAFLKTPLQDTIILTTRFILLSFLISFLAFDIKDLSNFILFYSIILSLGALTEIGVLIYVVQPRLDLLPRKEIVKTFMKSLTPHLDYLAFNCYPLILVVISGWYLEKAQIGRVNFALQIVNLIFLLSTTANIRVSAYMSDVGIFERKKQFNKLFKYTLLASIMAVSVIYFALRIVTKTSYFDSFDGVWKLFLIAAFSIPGYLMYQFFSPLWLEKKRVKESAYLNLFFLVVCISISPYFLKKWNEVGMVSLFSIFHLCLLGSQLVMFKLFYRKDDVLK